MPPTAMRNEGRSAPTKSIMMAPVMKIPTGKAPMPSQCSATRCGPDSANRSRPVSTRNNPRMIATAGPLTSFLHGSPPPPTIIQTPTDQTVISTPKLWTKSTPITPSSFGQSTASTGMAV